MGRIHRERAHDIRDQVIAGTEGTACGRARGDGVRGCQNRCGCITSTIADREGNLANRIAILQAACIGTELGTATSKRDGLAVGLGLIIRGNGQRCPVYRQSARAVHNCVIIWAEGTACDRAWDNVIATSSNCCDAPQ